MQAPGRRHPNFVLFECLLALESAHHPGEVLIDGEQTLVFRIYLGHPDNRIEDAEGGCTGLLVATQVLSGRNSIGRDLSTATRAGAKDRAARSQSSLFARK